MKNGLLQRSHSCQSAIENIHKVYYKENNLTGLFAASRNMTFLTVVLLTHSIY